MYLSRKLKWEGERESKKEREREREGVCEEQQKRELNKFLKR